MPNAVMTSGIHLLISGKLIPDTDRLAATHLASQNDAQAQNPAGVNVLAFL
jgi:hypothetical protein